MYNPESRSKRSTVPGFVKNGFELVQAGINDPVPPDSVISILPLTLSEQLICDNVYEMEMVSGSVIVYVEESAQLFTSVTTNL